MTIRLSADQAEELEIVASVDKIPMSEIIRIAITEYVHSRRQDEQFRTAMREHIERAQRILGQRADV